MLAQNIVVKGTYFYPIFNTDKYSNSVTTIKQIIDDYMYRYKGYDCVTPLTGAFFNYLNLSYNAHIPRNDKKKFALPWETPKETNDYLETLKKVRSSLPWIIKFYMKIGKDQGVDGLIIEVTSEPAIYYQKQQLNFKVLIDDWLYSNIVYDNTEFIKEMANAISFKELIDPKPVFEYQPHENNLGYVIPAGMDWSGKNILIDILKDLNGNVLICDPYLSSKTLYVLSKINNALKVKFITHNIENSKKHKEAFSKEFEDFKKEFKNIEFRISDENVLHDRFIIDDKKTWQIGTSLNNLGNKDTIISQLSVDVREALIPLLNNRWNDAHPLDKIEMK